MPDRKQATPAWEGKGGCVLGGWALEGNAYSCGLFPTRHGAFYVYSASIQTASPWAMPEQMAATPFFLPERRSS